MTTSRRNRSAQFLIIAAFGIAYDGSPNNAQAPQTQSPHKRVWVVEPTQGYGYSYMKDGQMCGSLFSGESGWILITWRSGGADADVNIGVKSQKEAINIVEAHCGSPTEKGVL